MTALSIRHMNFTLQAMELVRAQKDADDYREYKKGNPNPDPCYYWHIERKVRRGKNQKWIFVRDFMGTKAEIAAFFRKYYQGGPYRLRNLMKY